MKRAITDIGVIVDSLAPESKALWNSIFEVAVSKGELKIPAEFRNKVRDYFGDPDESVEVVCDRVKEQQIVRVRNRWTGEETLFNDLRARRPGVREDQMQQERAYVDEKVEETASGCDFCSPTEYTPEDVFGRISREFPEDDGTVHKVWTGSNVAKYDAWSSMVYFSHHHPLEFTPAELYAVIDAGFEWFRRVAAQDSEARYPFFMWNCLYKAGASRVHGHAQILMARAQPYARARLLFESADRYARWSSSELSASRDYFEDLWSVHRALGLGFLHRANGDDSVKVLVSITPTKEKETLIVAGKSPSSSSSTKEAVLFTLRSLLDDFHVTSFNVAMAMPYMGPAGEVPLCVTRIVERGPISKPPADMGGMELYGTAVVSTDPYVMAGSLGRRLKE